MMVSVETTGSLERRMKVQVPAARIEEEIDTRLRNVGKKAKLKGFRPGKVPLKVILIADGLKQLLAGKDFEFTAVFEVYPEIAIKDLEKLKVERPKTEIGEADVDAMVENVRRQNATFDPVERPAGEGDRVTVDFEGTVDGEPFDGGSGTEVPLLLGEGRMLKDFEEALIGISAAEERSFDVGFPGDYPASKLAGKTARFSVTARRVRPVGFRSWTGRFWSGSGSPTAASRSCAPRCAITCSRSWRRPFAAG